MEKKRILNCCIHTHTHTHSGKFVKIGGYIKLLFAWRLNYGLQKRGREIGGAVLICINI